MSLINFEDLISKYPQDREAIERLEDLIRKNSDPASGAGKVFQLPHLYDLISPSTELVLAYALNYLVKKGAMKKIVRVESSNYGGVTDYSSITEVPEIIHDWRQDIQVNVRPEDIKVLYQITPNVKKDLKSSGC